MEREEDAGAAICLLADLVASGSKSGLKYVCDC